MKKVIKFTVTTIIVIIIFYLLFGFDTYKVESVGEERVKMSSRWGTVVLNKTESDADVEVGDVFIGTNFFGTSPDPWGYAGGDASPQ